MLFKRRKAGQKLIKANRLYATISQVNQTIVHVTEAGELFKSVCRIAVEAGQFRMAWIGMIDEEMKLLVPVEYAGHEEGYLSEINISTDEITDDSGPSGQAIRRGENYICNDFKKDPGMTRWRKAATLRGYRSAIALPIMKFGKPVGSLALYATEAYFFDQEEVGLLNEVVKDISFALEFFDKESLRKRAEADILREKLFSDSMIKSLPGIFYLYDDTLRFLRWNQLFETFSGYTYDEISGMSPLDFFEGEHKTLLLQRIAQVFSEGASDMEADFVTKEGRKVPFYFTGVKVEFNNRNCLLGFGIDISELKDTENLLREMEGKYRKAQAIGRMGHWELDMQKRLVTWSEEVYHLYKMDYSESAIGYETCFDFIHPGDRDFFQKALDDALAGITKLDIVHRVILKDGSIRYFHAVGELREGHIGPLTEMTGTIQDVTERVRRELDIQQKNEQLRSLASSLQNIREEERADIAREIHDDLGQQLTAITLDTSWVGRKIAGAPEEVLQRINSIISMLNDVMSSIRRISTQLRPSVLDDLGLIEALQWQVREFQKRYGIPVTFDCAGDGPVPDPRTATGLFRIFQETLTNIVRHADATAITASLCAEGEQLVLRITDNGKGFDPEAAGKKKTLGLLGMKERALMMGGHLEIGSRPGEGTNISVYVPLKIQDNLSRQDNPSICVS